MDSDGKLKCQQCGQPVPVTADGEYAPHLQIPVLLGGDAVARVLLHLPASALRCGKCRFKMILAAAALCAEKTLGTVDAEAILQEVQAIVGKVNNG